MGIENLTGNYYRAYLELGTNEQKEAREEEMNDQLVKILVKSGEYPGADFYEYPAPEEEFIILGYKWIGVVRTGNSMVGEFEYFVGTQLTKEKIADWHRIKTEVEQEIKDLLTIIQFKTKEKNFHQQILEYID